MPILTPDWLQRHGCTLREGTDGRSCIVLLENAPQYEVIPKPVGGQLGCDVIQTVNGRRLGSDNRFPTSEEAVRGGLEELRQVLGW